MDAYRGSLLQATAAKGVHTTTEDAETSAVCSLVARAAVSSVVHAAAESQQSGGTSRSYLLSAHGRDEAALREPHREGVNQPVAIIDGNVLAAQAAHTSVSTCHHCAAVLYVQNLGLTITCSEPG